jgi:hypothetical protein
VLSLKVSGHAETEEHATTPWNDSMTPDIADESHTIFDEVGYSHLRILPSGELIGVCRYLFTYGLTIGIALFGYRKRWCYGREKDAIAAMERWDGRGDPPGPWIKQKPKGLRSFGDGEGRR